MSNRNFNPRSWDSLHFTRTEEYVRQVELIYQAAVDEAARLGSIAAIDPTKPFTFARYPLAKAKVTELLTRFADQIKTTILAGHQAEWDLANQKNDSLVSHVLGLNTTGLPTDQLSKYMGRNLEALAAFQNRKVAGLKLSQRVTQYTEQLKTELEMGLDVGLGTGKSAAQLSRDLRSYLNNPDKLFRRVRDKHGQLVLSRQAKAYNPGQGVYRSSYKNMLRLTRTEVNMAYREADHARWQSLDFVVGIEVRRSNNTSYGCDVCEALKGKYPKEFKFVGWHPQCRCHAISILASADELRTMDQQILSGQDTAGFQSVNQVTELPPNFVNWAQTNDRRLAKNPPLFITDNIKQGKFTLSVPPLAPDIDLSQYIAGSSPTNKEMKAIIMAFARLRPDTFSSGGLESISILQSQSYMMQHSRAYSSKTKLAVTKSSLSISTHSFPIAGQVFNPAEELRGALAAMKAGTPLTFNQEYSVEALWHEMLHAKSKTPYPKLNRPAVQDMETLNQFAARHTYEEFLKPFGVAPVHKQAILENGYGYKQWVAGFRSSLSFRGIDELQALNDLYPVLMEDYAKIPKAMRDYLKRK